MTEQMARLKTALAGRYTIEREIGSGGMATVYLADDLKHRRSVAIKVLKPEVAVALGPERFLREIAIAARLNHPHILALHDSGEAAGFLYYVAPYVEGKSLRERLAHQKQLAIEEAFQIAEQVAAALDYAHRQGVVHRDIKPENILLHEGSALIADFGIALAISAVGQERLTHSGFSVGTPEYMSPEQARGEPDLDGRSDVYSLGCLLYEMLAGEPPYAGPTAQAVIAKCLADRVPSVRRLRDNIAPHVDAALIRALAKVPSERFGCAGDFIAALTRAATGDARSIAVLPFANLSPDPDNEYFSDGITEDIITRLSKISALKVISRTSVMRFKNTTRSMREIAGALDVSTVLEGSVRRVGARVRVTAQLIDAGSDEHLWADTYDRELTDVFAIQTEVAEAIAIALHARLSSVEETRVRQRDAIDPETYRLCLVGRHHWNRWTEEDFAKSRAAYEAAIARDPACALAHAGLGQTLQTLSLGYWSVPGRPFFAPAKAALERALALDPELAEAHVWLAYATMQHDYDWVLANLKVQRALAVAPNSSAAHDVHGNILAATGRHTESRKACDRAVDLDPLSQFVLANAALCAHRGRDYDRALAFWERMITLDPDHHMGRLLGSLTLTAVGRVDEGLVSARGARSILGALADPTLANACAAGGRADEARDILARCEARRRSQHGWPFALAMGYARLGEIDTAFARLQEAYEERDFWMVWLGVQPELDPLRADPRYHALLRQVNLAGGAP